MTGNKALTFSAASIKSRVFRSPIYFVKRTHPPGNNPLQPMKFLTRTLLASALLWASISRSVEAAEANLIKQFDLVASRFVADPARHQIYASITGDNSVVVIDTNSLAVTKTLAIGSAPMGMAMSPDGAKLYVALSGANQIGVIILTNLAISAPLTIAIKPHDVAAGLGNRLYVTPAEQGNKLLQIDATTGATQAILDDPDPYINGRFQMSPDQKTLYFANQGLSPGTVERYDVATGTAVLEESSNANGGAEIRLSHDGQFLTTRYDLFDAANFKVFEGTFADINGDFMKTVAFSPDDTVLYQYDLFANQVNFFSTENFLQVAALELATSDASDVFDLITDATARYLVVASDAGILVYDLFAISTVSTSGTVGLTLDYHPPIYLEAPTITTSELPPGLIFDQARQAITGRPTETGSFTVVVTGVGQGHTVTATVNLTIVPNQIGQPETSTNLVERLNLVASRFLGDAARKRIYASLSGENSVAVIDTAGLGVMKTLVVGSAPFGMAMSPDGKKLYVALSGATKIAIIDLDTLTVLPGLLVGEKPYQIEAGLGNRLYVTPLIEDYDLLQIDATTGATEGVLDSFPYRNGLLQISPDRNTLYFGNNGISPATLERFDVSTATAVLDESIRRDGGGDLTLSHAGQLLSFPLNSINPSDFKVVYGNYDDATTGPLSYSPNDGVAYSYDLYENKADLFSTTNFVNIAAVDVSDRARCGEFCAGSQMVSDLITDETGRYLFLAEDSSLPIYDLVADVSISVSGTVGQSFVYQLPIYFDASQIIPDGLPPGLFFDSTTRSITGTPVSDGSYPIEVSASDGTNSITINLMLNLYPNSRAQNISTRLAVQTGDDVLISGFIITGNETKEVVMRALGPSLEVNGQPVAGRLGNPTLELHDGSGALIASNDDWASDDEAGVLINLSIAPSSSLEAALYRRLAPGAYTMIVRGSGNTTGIALAEVYDIDSQAQTTMAGGSRLANISTRGKVQTGDNVMIGGFIVGGDDDAMMLIRAIGPSLFDAGVAGVLQDPQLDLFDSQGTKIASNDNWKDIQETEIIASGLAPTDDRESAINITLPPASYTAIVSGVGGLTGVALVEAYNLP